MPWLYCSGTDTARTGTVICGRVGRRGTVISPQAHLLDPGPYRGRTPLNGQLATDRATFGDASASEQQAVFLQFPQDLVGAVAAYPGSGADLFHRHL